MAMTLIVVACISYVMAVIIEALASFITGVYTYFFYSAFAFERICSSSVQSINISGIYGIVYKFAILLLIMFFIKKLIETYLMWTNGDPDTSPFTILINFLKALIVMIFFGFIYRVFVDVMYEFYKSILTVATGSTFEIVSNFNTIIEDGSFKSTMFNIFGCTLVLIVFVQLALLYFQNLSRGIQILILRIGIPFASIGLLNSDGGAFKGYIKKFIQNAFTVIIQCLLIQFAFMSIGEGAFVIGLMFSTTALKVPTMLQEFLISSGSFTERGVGSAISSLTGTIHHASSIFSRK